MKIIIIGATGTIGAAVASTLEKEHEVIRASRKGCLNAVCPPMASETAEKMGWGPGGVPVAEIAKYYVHSVESNLNGTLIGPTHSG